MLPRVTEILKSAGLIDTAFMTEDGRERGSMVHLACQYMDEGDLDPESVDETLAGYLEAYRDFRQQQGDKAMWIELPLQDPKGLYRGTTDRVLTDRPRALYEIKTSVSCPWARYQTAAYVAMLPDPFSYSRYGVFLKPNGKYSIREYPKTEYVKDLNVFMAALAIFYAKQEMGKKENNGNGSTQ